MLEVKGTYNTAKVFTEVVDQESIAQITNLCNQPFTQGHRIRMMPDVHAGAGCTIGTTMSVSDRIVPYMIGVDISCGMETIQIKEKRLNLPQLDKVIRQGIPSGFNINSSPHRFSDEVDVTKLKCYDKIDARKAVLSISSLGGGNHFLEANVDEDGNIYIVVHSGSRNLGLKVAEYYQNLAYQQMKQSEKDALNEAIFDLKQQGREKEIVETISSKRFSSGMPKDLCPLTGYAFDDYVHDMKIMQEYASWNRKAMIDVIIRGMKLKVEDQFTTIHNYLDTDLMILRKGAVSALDGERLLIPINMRDGSLICIGKGNVDWNYSAPHGAGRLMSRTQAKQSFTVNEFKKQMEGIYTTSVGKDTIDECPMAYKGMDDIVNNIGDTVTIEKVIRPIYNFKAGGN